MNEFSTTQIAAMLLHPAFLVMPRRHALVCVLQGMTDPEIVDRIGSTSRSGAETVLKHIRCARGYISCVLAGFEPQPKCAGGLILVSVGVYLGITGQFYVSAAGVRNPAPTLEAALSMRAEWKGRRWLEAEIAMEQPSAYRDMSEIRRIGKVSKDITGDFLAILEDPSTPAYHRWTATRASAASLTAEALVAGEISRAFAIFKQPQARNMRWTVVEQHVYRRYRCKTGDHLYMFAKRTPAGMYQELHPSLEDAVAARDRYTAK